MAQRKSFRYESLEKINPHGLPKPLRVQIYKKKSSHQKKIDARCKNDLLYKNSASEIKIIPVRLHVLLRTLPVLP